MIDMSVQIETLSNLIDGYREERQRVARDYRLPAEGKAQVLLEARQRFGTAARAIVEDVLGSPSVSGLTGGRYWAALEEAEGRLHAAYDTVDKGVDFTALAYARDTLPATLSRYQTVGDLERALPSLGATVRRALADSPETLRRAYPNENVGGVLATLRAEQDARVQGAVAAHVAALDALGAAGWDFVAAARVAASEMDTGGQAYLADILHHIHTAERVDPVPGGQGVTREVSRTEAQPIDVGARGGAMRFEAPLL